MKNVTPMGQVRAVQYLRMSTEHQRYSLENQSTAIAAYANGRGYAIVGTYADPARSGLTLRERKGLGRLLRDARNPSRDFSVILVLDVSRWGRFQDPDQGATYEFLCREAGVSVEYCLEAFENDGSFAASIIKHLKRIMAAEYSRELSSKVSRAHVQQAKLGFVQGGCLVYGVRRMLIDAKGNERGFLGPGEHKHLSTDRVILVRGPESEVRVARRIFKAYTVGGESMSGIARQLNDEGVPGACGRKWTPERVHWLLTSELMLGTYVYNRTTRKLKSPARANPKVAWVRARVMRPIVSRATFEQAAALLRRGRRVFPYADPRLLTALSRLLREKGFLSFSIIDACPYTPNARTYQQHFGTLERAYALVGYQKPPGTWQRRRTMWSKERLLEGLRRLYERHGHVSGPLITGDPTIPAVSTYRRRFGSSLSAYEQAGLIHTRSELASAARRRMMPRP